MTDSVPGSFPLDPVKIFKLVLVCYMKMVRQPLLRDKKSGRLMVNSIFKEVRA